MDKTGFSGLLNNISWYNYKLIENTATLQTILKWIELSKRLEEGYYNLDTYAHILYGLGKRSEAIEAQTRAIKLAEKEKQRTSLEKMNLDLEKMKKGSVLTN
jgi:predicted RNA polymerase sigma factor